MRGKAYPAQALDLFGGMTAMEYRFQQVYRLEPPTRDIEYVVVSAVKNEALGLHETYIFHSDEQGNILSWSELEGSYKNGLNHAVALSGFGYRVLTDIEQLADLNNKRGE